jgi:hypothetical protein
MHHFVLKPKFQHNTVPTLSGPRSSVFGTNGTTETPTTQRNKPGNDSYSRMFGPLKAGPKVHQ